MFCIVKLGQLNFMSSIDLNISYEMEMMPFIFTISIALIVHNYSYVELPIYHSLFFLSLYLLKNNSIKTYSFFGFNPNLIYTG